MSGLRVEFTSAATSRRVSFRGGALEAETMVELVVAAVLVVVLLLVLTRLLRVGCRLVMFLFYFGILAVAAALFF